MTILQQNGFYEYSSFFGIDGQNEKFKSRVSVVICAYISCLYYRTMLKHDFQWWVNAPVDSGSYIIAE
jgi:hypothetical protein